jgi:hypothetical protein
MHYARLKCNDSSTRAEKCGLKIDILMQAFLSKFNKQFHSGYNDGMMQIQNKGYYVWKD